MAGSTAHLLDYAMFIDPRAGQIGMALEACRYLLLDRALQLLLENGMGIVACGTFHRTVVDLMVNGSGKLSPDAAMAPIAKRGLRVFQQLPFLTGVDRVATDASNVSIGVRRLREIRMTRSVTTEAKGVDPFGRNPGRVADQSDIAVVLGMRLAVAVAAIAGNASCSVSAGRFSMRARCESFDQVSMAGATGFGGGLCHSW